MKPWSQDECYSASKVRSEITESSAATAEGPGGTEILPTRLMLGGCHE